MSGIMERAGNVKAFYVIAKSETAKYIKTKLDVNL